MTSWLRRTTLAVAVALSSLAPAVPARAGQEVAQAAPLVRVPFPQEDGSLTPYTFELGYSLMTLVYDTLLWRDAGGTPKPWLAEAVDVSADGRNLTVRLREGATWHDGRPVTSDDVAFTFRYVVAHPHPRFTGEVGAVERVDTPDPRTAVIRLRRPSPGFLDQPLADLPILPRHLWENLPRGRVAPEGLPVGSGPYRLVEHRLGERYRFEANAGYFRGAPAVSAIDVPIIRMVDDTIKALERRDVDMVPFPLPRPLVDRVDDLSIEIEEGPSYLGTVLMLNVRTAPFDRPEIRQAVARALDLGRLARTAGRAVPATRGYVHPDSHFAPGEDLHQRDVAGARPVLRSLQVPIEILVPDNDPVRAEAGRQVVQSLSGAGALVQLRSVSRDELSRAVGEDGSPPSFQAAVWAAPALASYDPDFLARLFGSDPAAAPFNYSGYRSAAFDDAIQRVATTPDPLQRTSAAHDALRVLAADVPVVPLFFSTGSFAYRAAVYRGWVFVKGTGILDKQSFLAAPGPTEEQEPPAGGTPALNPVEPEQSGGGLSAVRLVAVGILVLAGVLAAVAAAGAVRDRRARRG